MEIKELIEFTNESLMAINKLLPQLSSSAKSLTERELKKIIESETTRFLIAVENDIIYGSLTLILFTIPTGCRAWIEDVVVNDKARGKGVGKRLTEFAINLAKEFGAKTVDLTSRPSREAANALYKKAGFKLRDTNVYRYEIT